MKIPYSWLQQMLPQLPTVDALEGILASMGLPLEETVTHPAPQEGVIAAAVLAAEPVPETKLTRLTLDIGGGNTAQIASAAPNAVGLPAGALVALATPGTVVGSNTIAVRTLQGVESWGMAMSEAEMNIGTDNAGLFLMPAGEAQAGQPMAELWPADTVLDVEVTPNRADVLSVHGLARDLAAFLELPAPVLPPLPAPQAQKENRFVPRIAAEPLALDGDTSAQLRSPCVGLGLIEVDGVADRPSPLWLRRLITLSGMRPRNLAVDASNWAMLELGQPTAVYNASAVSGNVVLARMANQEEEFADLLGKTSTLGPQDLLIADESGQILSLAGIVGGESASVSAENDHLLYEAATFDPVVLRRSGVRHQLKTDALYRFERGVDTATEFASLALRRIAALLQALRPSVQVSDVKWAEQGRPRPADIALSPSVVRDFLGMDVSDETMKDALERLGCTVTAASEGFTVAPPSWRVDMHIWQDLAEEIARLVGYDALPETLPHFIPNPSQQLVFSASRRRETLRAQLAGLGLQEVVSYTFASPEAMAAAAAPEMHVFLQKPQTPERSGMRTALYPSLLQTLAAAGPNEDRLLFEIGHVFPASGEAERLGVLMRGDYAPAGPWQAGLSGGFYTFKGLVEALATLQGASLQLLPFQKGEAPAALHPGVAARVIWNGEDVGWMGALHPHVAQKTAAGAAFILEVALPLPERAWAFSEPSRAPEAWRDLAVLLPQDTPYSDIEARLLAVDSGEIRVGLTPFDVYSGPNLAGGLKSVAVRLRYQGSRTLGEEDIDPLFAAHIEAVRAAGWNIRERE